jgi:hypothetical protein
MLPSFMYVTDKSGMSYRMRFVTMAALLVPIVPFGWYLASVIDPILRHHGLSRIAVALILLPTFYAGGYLGWALFVLLLRAKFGPVPPRWLARVFFVKANPRAPNSN